MFTPPSPGFSTTGTPARTGNAYAGIYARAVRDEREYLIHQLDQPLTAGRPYYVEFFAKIAPASEWQLTRLEAAFTAAPPVSPTQTVNPAQFINSQAVNIVASSLAPGSKPTNPINTVPATVGAAWTAVGGAFVAGPNYRHLVIGNFHAGDTRENGPAITGAYTPQTYYNGAYYYIEDVSLVAFPSAGPAAVAAACYGQVPLGGCPLPASANASYSWSPTVGLDNPNILNPTATLANQPITYTLTVTAGGRTYTTSTTLTPSTNGQPCPPPQCLHPYKQNAKATYKAPLGRPAYELGDANTSNWPANSYPIIDGGGGRVVFDGIYHVVSPVELRNGIFTTSPGTVFYVDGSFAGSGNYFASYNDSCYYYGSSAAPVGLHQANQFRVGRDAHLKAVATTFTATCDEQWAGIKLVANGSLTLTADPATGKRSRIEQAQAGILLGTPCSGNDVNCRVNDTDFINDGYGISSLGFPSRRDPARNQVTGCLFRSDPSQMLPPYMATGVASYTRVGLTLHGAWHDGIEYSGNTFNLVYVGVELGGGTQQMRLHHNSFSENYGTAIRVGGYYTYTKPGEMWVNDNTIEVPDNPSPGGQVPAGAPAYGLQVLPLGQGGQALHVEANTVQGQNGRGNAQKSKIGLDMQLSFREYYVQRQNQWRGLDTGIQLLDAAAANTQTEHLTDNYFAGCGTAVLLTGRQYAPFAPVVSCNTIENGDYGVYVDQSSDVGQLSGPQGGPGPFGMEPVANSYNGLNMADVQNDGANSVDYYALISPDETGINVQGGNALNILPTIGTPCNQRPAYGAGVYGLQRPTAGSGTTAQQVQTWENHVSTAYGPPAQQHRETLLLLDYRERTGQLAQLESFITTLHYTNTPAFDRLSLYLMERYRQLGQPANAQRVRNQLLNLRGQNAEVSQRVAYFDVAGRLTALAPGALPTPADSTALANVAQSTAGFAPVACATLRYFYPQVLCGTTAGGGSAGSVGVAQRLAALRTRNVQPLAVRTYPNPAYDRLTVQVEGAAPAARWFELREVATGRLVARHPISDQASLQLPVTGIAPGVYVGQLLGNSRQPLATCKVVIVQ